MGDFGPGVVAGDLAPMDIVAFEDFPSAAFLAASSPTCLIASVNGVATPPVAPLGLSSGAAATGGAALEGVLIGVTVADPKGVAAGAPTSPICSRSSPYSFHSSISVRSCRLGDVG